MSTIYENNKEKLKELTTHYFSLGVSGRWKLSTIEQNKTTGDYEVRGGCESRCGYVDFVVTIENGKFVVNGAIRDIFSRYGAFPGSLMPRPYTHVQSLYAHLNRVTAFVGEEDTPFWPHTRLPADMEP